MCQHIIWQAQKKTVLEMFCADRTASSARKLVLPVAERSEILSTYKDKRILVVEDAYFLSDEVRQKLVSLGALVVGPVATVTDAMDLIDGSEIDAAILDVHLGDGLMFPVADRLDELDIPFVFATGHDPVFIAVAYSGFSLCAKPMELAKIAKALWGGAFSELN